MKLYLCYVYTWAKIPHLSVIGCHRPGDISKEIEKIKAEWPNFTRIDVYDDDRCVLQVRVETGDQGRDRQGRAGDLEPHSRVH